MTNRQKVRQVPTCLRQALERSRSPGGKDKVIKEAYCPRETFFRVCGGARGNTPQPEGFSGCQEVGVGQEGRNAILEDTRPGL